MPRLTCGNPVNYLLGISVQWFKNSLSQWLQSPMENFMRSFSSSLSFSHSSLSPLDSGVISVQVIFFASNKMEFCLLMLNSKEAPVFCPLSFWQHILTCNVGWPENTHSYHFPIFHHLPEGQVFLCRLGLGYFPLLFALDYSRGNMCFQGQVHI